MTYRSEVNSIHPVAIKLGQKNVNAPDHYGSLVVPCDACKDEFALNPNRMHGWTKPMEECVVGLRASLAQDHQAQRQHQDSYEFPP